MLQASALAGATLAFGPVFWRQALAAPARPGPGPYGPPGAPDAATGIAVPNGFSVKEVARGGAPVGTTGYTWHGASDGTGTFAQPGGGWILTSNSEVGAAGGGASSITFAPDGSITGARRILSGTTSNCSGGVTPWGTWLSGEETTGGAIWECDPKGLAAGIQRPALGRFSHEAVCVDPVGQRLYLTEDTADGCFYRFTPATYPDLSSGLLEVMLVDGAGRTSWATVPDPSAAIIPTRSQVPGAAKFARGEGTWYDTDVVYFVTTTQSRLYALHLRQDLLELVYDGSALVQPPELSGIDNVTVHPLSGEIYVSEDEYADATLDVGIITPEREFARFLTVSGGQHAGSELTGPSFDPSGTRFYIASQRSGGVGAVYEVTGPFRLVRPTIGNQGGSGTGTGGGTGAGGGAKSAPDTRRPAASLRVLGKATVRGFRTKGLPVRVKVDEPAAVSVVVRTLPPRRGGKRPPGTSLARGRAQAARPGEVALTLKPSRSTADRLRRRRTVPIEIEVRATDAAGNQRRVKKAITLG